ncbi:alpha/beta fold hydrolase [Candidatus Hydrogenedentota bacterium]
MKPSIQRVIILLLTFNLACATNQTILIPQAANSPQVDRDAASPEPTFRNVVYGNEDPASQALDVYLAGSTKPTPAMIHIHGGGWRWGKKERIPPFLSELLSEGISVISVEYRRKGVQIYPVEFDDCTRAIQFIRYKAKEWNIDPDRIGVTGGSSGGHVTLWTGLRDDAANLNSEDPVERESSRTACLVNICGPTDFSLLDDFDHNHGGYRALFGIDMKTPSKDLATTVSKELQDKLSPINYVSADDPPVLTCHGTADNIVPVQHAYNLDVKLRQHGVRSTLILVEGGGHGFHDQRPWDEILKFIKKHLLK